MDHREHVTELQKVLNDWLFPGISASFVEALFEQDPLLKGEGDDWGFSDTVVREQAMDAAAQLLLAIP